MKKSRLILIALSGGLLWSLAWQDFFPGFIIFFAFVPLLIIEDKLYSNREFNTPALMFLYSYLHFGFLNLLSFWWLYKASLFGPLAAVFMNAFFMAIPVWLFHITKRKLGPYKGYFAFFIYWIAFEHLHTNWDFSVPWLSLGNGLSKEISLIQWYEFTGVAGGTLWILLINFIIFRLLKSLSEKNKIIFNPGKVSVLLIIILFPIITSLIIFSAYKEKENPFDIVVVQPNIDPYLEKFDGMTIEAQVNRMLDLADKKADSNTDYIVGPETSMPNYVFERHLKNDYYTLMLRNFLKKYPNTNFILGINSRKLYKEGERQTSSSRKFENTNDYYDVFNTAMQIDSAGNIQLYHKSQLFMGVEKIPYHQVFRFLDKLSINLGGIGGTNGKQKERGVFFDKNSHIGIGPVICWESVYGDYVTDYIKNGANFIFVITNDGWWSDTPGYKAHLRFSQLRAIENRRSIARSANTGISCFINQKGEIIQPTEWWTATAIRDTINANDRITFYTKHGDYLGRISDFLAIFLLLITFIRPRLKKNHMNSVIL